MGVSRPRGAAPAEGAVGTPLRDRARGVWSPPVAQVWSRAGLSRLPGQGRALRPVEPLPSTPGTHRFGVPPPRAGGSFRPPGYLAPSRRFPEQSGVQGQHLRWGGAQRGWRGHRRPAEESCSSYPSIFNPFCNGRCLLIHIPDSRKCVKLQTSSCSNCARDSLKNNS